MSFFWEIEDLSIVTLGGFFCVSFSYWSVRYLLVNKFGVLSYEIVAFLLLLFFLAFSRSLRSWLPLYGLPCYIAFLFFFLNNSAAVWYSGGVLRGFVMPLRWRRTFSYLYLFVDCSVLNRIFFTGFKNIRILLFDFFIVRYLVDSFFQGIGARLVLHVRFMCSCNFLSNLALWFWSTLLLASEWGRHLHNFIYPLEILILRYEEVVIYHF